MSTIEKKSLKVGKYVNTEHVDNVISNYKRERWAHNSKRIGKEDSLSAWWSVEEMEAYLEKAKMSGANGVRIYFGAYSEDFSAVPEFAGRQTLVMVATKTKRVDGKLAHKEIYITGENGKPTILAYNMPNICPPFCPPPGGGGLGKANLGVTIVEGEDGMSVI